MSNAHPKAGLDPSTLPRLVHPPSNLQQLIETVAEYVAHCGPAIEFQLRSGADGQHKYPFLFLDHEYNPFYQLKLAQAREKHRVAMTIATTLPSGKANGHNNRDYKIPKQNPRTANPDQSSVADHVHSNHLEHDHSRVQNLPLDTSSESSDTESGCQRIGNERRHHHQKLKAEKFDTSKTVNDTISPGQQLHQAQNQTQNLSYPQNAAATLGSDLFDGQATNSTTEVQEETRGIVPYGILQEVHILDTAGNERAGLNTFIIAERLDEEVEDPLMHALYHSPVPVVDHEPVYRLRPVTSVNYRTVHHRLLPVGFALGAEVIQAGSINPGIVVQRTVIHGQRVYDVKDTQGVTHKEIPEIELQPHSGGSFSFRLPSSLSDSQ